jgi:hypothetical protein
VLRVFIKLNMIQRAGGILYALLVFFYYKEMFSYGYTTFHSTTVHRANST